MVSWPRSFEVAGTPSMAYRAVAAAAQLKSRPASPLPLRFSLLDGLAIGDRPSQTQKKKSPDELFASRPSKDEHRAAVGVFDSRVRISWADYAQRGAIATAVVPDGQRTHVDNQLLAEDVDLPDPVAETVPIPVPDPSPVLGLPIAVVEVGPSVRRPLDEYPEDVRRRVETKMARNLRRKARRKENKRLGHGKH